MVIIDYTEALADWNSVPTGSMKPTILEGDQILVNRMTYDLRVPFTHTSLYRISDPLRGDIIVFDSKVSDMKLVKRVVGVPGDVVQLSDNVLMINGEQLPYEDIASTQLTVDRLENIFGLEHAVRVRKSGSRLSSFRSLMVPADKYLALGDNRDNSADSRVIGFIPRSEIVGRSRSVVVSFDYENFYMLRADRFFHTL